VHRLYDKADKLSREVIGAAMEVQVPARIFVSFVIFCLESSPEWAVATLPYPRTSRLFLHFLHNLPPDLGQYTCEWPQMNSHHGTLEGQKQQEKIKS
jgi:hypothetical protein